MTKTVTAALAAILILAAPTAQAGGFWKPFLAGAVSGLVIHEGSHLALDIAFDADPRLKGVSFGPIPFFAITHRGNLSPRREALVSGAGFLSQHFVSEIVLSRRGAEESLSPFGKGLLTFHVATSAAYAGAAFSRYGPFERDTRGVADATRSDERLIGALILAPAAFDAWRYFRPRSRIARWGSRLGKAAFLGVITFKK